MIQRIYLNKDWLFDNNKKKELVNIPHTVCELPYNYLNEDDYQMISTYTKDILIPDTFKDMHLFLTFDGVLHKTEVYVNDKLVLEHYCGYDRFSVDIKDFVEYGKNNNIRVIVDSNESLNIPPFGNVIDYLTYGGIYRDVYLDISNDNYVKDLFIKPINEDDKWYALFQVTLNNLCNYKINIYYNNELVITKDITPKELIEDIKIEFNNPKLWDIDNPNLYTVKIIIDDDIFEDTFGLRVCKFLNDGFYLNNKKIKILGLNRHQAYPYVGYAMPKSMQELDAKILKEELHVNAVRTSHYMQSKYFIDMCDKLGLLVFTESPGWQYIGDEAWKKQALENMKNMVLQYRNHPSIILWGARINESRDDHDFYSKSNELIRSLDPTRQTGGVRCYTFGEELEDVYTYNDFYDPKEKRGLAPKNKVVKGNIPYLVSEFNGHMHPTKMIDNELVRVKQALRICKGMNEFYSDDDITGFFVWCMNDYNTHKEFGSGDRICYHGVLDMFRNPKISAYLYQSQGSDDYLMLSSNLNIGDYNASTISHIYAFTNADEVRLYRNNELIKTYHKKDSPYPNIPNSPIIIDDFIGNLLEVKEGYSHKVAENMKAVLSATLKYGNRMPFKYKLMFLKLMLFHKVTYEVGYNLYGKYVGNWGSNEIVYKFEGVKNDKVFKTIELSKARTLHLEYTVSNTLLVDDNTYDVALVRIKAVDQNENILPYYNEPFKIDSEGTIDIIGPKLLSFKGGYSGIFVKTNGNKGKGILKIETAIEAISIEFNVK